jgi:hypothetical protein
VRADEASLCGGKGARVGPDNPKILRAFPPVVAATFELSDRLDFGRKEMRTKSKQEGGVEHHSQYEAGRGRAICEPVLNNRVKGDYRVV